MAELEVSSGDFLEIKLFTHLDGQLGINVHYGQVGAIDSAAATRGIGGMADALGTWFAPAIKALICTPAKYLGLSLRVQEFDAPTVKWATAWSKTGAGFGTAGATPCPKQVSGLFSKRTAYAGAKEQGRTFVPFPATADVEPNGNPTLSYLSRLTAYAQRVDGDEGIVQGGGGQNTDVIFGLYKWGQIASFRPTMSVVIRDAFATQMRRGDYGKVNAIPDELK